MAALAIRTGIPPNEFINMDSQMLKAMLQVLQDQADEVKNAKRRSGKRTR